MQAKAEKRDADEYIGQLTNNIDLDEKKVSPGMFKSLINIHREQNIQGRKYFIISIKLTKTSVFDYHPYGMVIAKVLGGNMNSYREFYW